MSKSKAKLLLLDIVILVCSIALDQFTKYLAVLKLKDKASIPIIKDVFELSYLENRGAAFGMLQDQKVFFVMVAIVIISVIAFILYKTPDHRKYIKLHMILVLIAGGAVGNMMDRIRYDYVVDFFYFVLINFPIFNVADVYVTLATAYLVILLLFVYKEEDLSFLSFKQNKYRAVPNQDEKGK